MAFPDRGGKDPGFLDSLKQKQLSRIDLVSREYGMGFFIYKDCLGTVIFLQGMISEETVDEIRRSSDLVSIAGEYTRLEKKGNSYLGLCPFHSEKTPSFSVSPEKQLFYCFGCAASGNVFSFIMKIENLTFPEAARHLARRAGLRITEGSSPGRREGDLKEKLLLLNELAARFYASCLKGTADGERANRYLQERGINAQSGESFKLGYAPRGWDSFMELARKKGFPAELLMKAGLVSSREGGFFDRFRHRLIFPIFDIKGRVVGFGGRALEEGQFAGPKYLNSPETPVFDKGSILYGMHLAREQIRRLKTAVVVEGYTDVISAHQAGLNNVVASLGTSLTAGQARQLRLQAETVIIAYDADAAGQAAAWRGLKVLREAGCRVKVAELPAQTDPDSLIRTQGAAVFAELLDRAVLLVDYQLKRVRDQLDISSEEGRLDYLAAVLPVLQAIPNLMEQEIYIKKVAEELGLAENSLRTEMKRFSRSAGTKTGSVYNLYIKDQTKYNYVKISPAEKMLLALMLKDGRIAGLTRQQLGGDDFENLFIRQVVELIWRLSSSGARITGQGIIDYFSDPGIHKLITEAAIDRSLTGLSPEMMARMAGDCIRNLINRKLDRRREALHKELRLMEKQGLSEEARSLLQQNWPKLGKLEKGPYRSGEGEGF